MDETLGASKDGIHSSQMVTKHDSRMHGSVVQIQCDLTCSGQPAAVSANNIDHTTTMRQAGCAGHEV